MIDLARESDAAGCMAVVSFHGILDGGGNVPTAPQDGAGARILMCHGDADPFVPPDQLEACKSSLTAAAARWDLMTFSQTMHSFTNPAQRLNSNPAFEYNERAARLSWEAAVSLLHGAFGEGGR